MRTLLPLLALFAVVPAASSAPKTPHRPAKLKEMCGEARQHLGEARRAVRDGRTEEARSIVRDLLLDGGATVGSHDPRVTRAILDGAIGRWQKPLKETIFASTGDAAPEIEVRLASQIDGVDDVQGEVEFKDEVSDDGQPHVGAIIRVRDNVDGRPIKANEMTTVITHELGHVLGLEDDPGGEGIMAEFDPADPDIWPSTAEVTNVERLRTDCRALLSRIP